MASEKEAKGEETTTHSEPKTVSKVYKYKYKTGGLGLEYKNKAEEKVSIRFEKGTYVAKDEETIEFLDGVIAKQKTGNSQRIFTLSEYNKTFKPEDEFITLDDNSLVNRGELAEILKYAKEAGYQPQITQVEHTGKTEARIIQGTQTAQGHSVNTAGKGGKK